MICKEILKGLVQNGKTIIFQFQSGRFIKMKFVRKLFLNFIHSLCLLFCLKSDFFSLPPPLYLSYVHLTFDRETWTWSIRDDARTKNVNFFYKTVEGDDVLGVGRVYFSRKPLEHVIGS